MSEKYELIQQSFLCIDALRTCSDKELAQWELSVYSGCEVVRLVSVDEFHKQRHFYGDRAAEFFCRLFFEKSPEPLSIMCIGTYYYDCLCKKNGKNVEQGLELDLYSKRKKTRAEIDTQLRQLMEYIPRVVPLMFGKKRWFRIDSYLTYIWLGYQNGFLFHSEILKKWREHPNHTLYIANFSDLVERAYELAILFRCIIWFSDATLIQELEYETEMSVTTFFVLGDARARLESILYGEQLKDKNL